MTLHTKYWYCFKVPGQRYFKVSHRLPINHYRMTKHFTQGEADKYAQEMNRQQYERDYGVLPRVRICPQMELDI